MLTVLRLQVLTSDRPSRCTVPSAGYTFPIRDRSTALLHLSRFATFGLLMLTLAPLLPAREPPATLPRFLLSWGQNGDKPGEFHSPIGIAVDKADHVYVTDFRNRRVQKFTADGKFVSAFKVTGTPSGIAVDSASNVYIAQWDPDRLCVYDATGNLLRQWGKSGNGNG